MPQARTRTLTLLTTLACLLAAGPGRADDDRAAARVPLHPAYKQELSLIHI